MNNKVLIAAVTVLLLLFGGWYFLSNKNSNTPALSQTDNNVNDSQLAQTEGNSLKDLFASGVSQTCTFNVSDESYTSEGKVYVANKKMRGDFTTTVDGTLQNTHMIVDGTTSYVWVDGQSQGFKMTFGEEEKALANSQTANSGTVDLDAKYNYDCDSGTVSESNFELPKNVNFASLDEMMGGYKDKTSSQCAACDSLSGDAKTQCLTMLKCN